MESRASLFVLALLLGFSQALYLNQRQHVDITEIISINDGSSELLVEGDILLPRDRNAKVCATNKCFWKKSSNGLVELPYTVSDVFTDSDRTVIVNAMATFQNKTCIRFVPRTNQSDYISIENKDGCYSNIGRGGGAQVLSLSKSGCVYNNLVQHELTHALGFFHEHTRSDRDNYVVINWANIDQTQKHNFEVQNTNNLNTTYDYSSVMHYGKTAFSINGLQTITAIPDPSVKFGQAKELSAIDILRINTLYNC